MQHSQINLTLMTTFRDNSDLSISLMWYTVRSTCTNWLVLQFRVSVMGRFSTECHVFSKYATKRVQCSMCALPSSTLQIHVSRYEHVGFTFQCQVGDRYLTYISNVSDYGVSYHLVLFLLWNIFTDFYFKRALFVVTIVFASKDFFLSTYMIYCIEIICV